MLIHNVFFWLRDDVSAAQSKEFRRLLESLREIASVHVLYIGTPAEVPPRPTVDRSYTYGLSIVFKDIAAHDAYQVDPLHLKFGEFGRPLWVRVQVYDIQT